MLTDATGVTKPADASSVSWPVLAWTSALILLCYFPVISRLVHQWATDDDMGHGFFVPAIAGYIAYQKLDGTAGVPAKPDFRAIFLLVWAALQAYLATLGAELFLARTAIVLTIIGSVWLLCGLRYLRIFAFPLGLLFLMIPIPAIIYNSITFPLQLFATRVAEMSLNVLGIPVMSSGNVLELADMKLNVVDACSGIRSLLSLTFLSLIYGYFFEKSARIRAVLFLSTLPIAILANAGRVTMTGILGQFDAKFAEGLYHEAEGWVVFMIAVTIMVGVHQALTRIAAIRSRPA